MPTDGRYVVWRDGAQPADRRWYSADVMKLAWERGQVHHLYIILLHNNVGLQTPRRRLRLKEGKPGAARTFIAEKVSDNNKWLCTKLESKTHM